MATPRTTTQPAQHRATRTLAVLGVTCAAALSALPPSAGHAAPKPSLQEVTHRVDALNAQVDVVVEDYASSKVALAGATRRAHLAESRVRVAQVRLDAVKRSMSATAAAVYRTGGTGEFVSLINTASPKTFLDRASSLERIATTQGQQLEAAATARRHLDAVRSEAAHELAAQRKVATSMAAQRVRIESALAQEQTLLKQLAGAARASRGAARTPVNTPTSYTGPASGQAGVAVREAYAQLGKPYKWGASGPNEFDCSGLTAWVWAKAGVSLTHSSRAQRNEGQHVSQADTQPGDLVFFGSPIHHEGIYVGNGNMISAPHTGDVVKVQPAFRSDYVGTTRP